MVLSPEEIKKLEGLLHEAEGMDSPILFLLHRIQELWGSIPNEIAVIISKRLDVPMTQIYSAATFYEEFTTEPAGKNIIKVCRGIVCHSAGSSQILETVLSHLEIQEGQTTEDGMFTVLGSSCIGQCDGAPAMMVNGVVHRNLDPSKAIELIDGIRKGGD